MNNGTNVVYFVKRILKLKKEPNSLHKGFGIIKLQLMLSHHYTFGELTLEEYKSLKYFCNKLLTNDN